MTEVYSPPIFKLTNDCLHLILSYFDIVELLRLEGISPTFDDVIRTEYKSRRKFNYYKYEKRYGREIMTVDQVSKIAQRIGPNLQTLNMYYWFSYEDVIRKFTAMLEYCDNLEYLRFPDNLFQIFDDEACRGLLMKKSEKLKSVRMDQNVIFTLHKANFVLDDEKSQFLRTAANLESLCLDNIDIDGRWFLELPKLREFRLIHCKTNLEEQFLDFIERQTILEELELSYCEFFNDRCLDAITKHSKNLRSLGITSDDRHFRNLTKIADLPKLTEIRIRGVQPVQDLLEKMAEGNVLERLAISDFGGSPLTMETLLPLRKFRNLRSLEVKSCHFIDDFLKILPSERNKIEEFDFSCSKITDEGVVYLVQIFKVLRRIILADCENLTKELATKLQPDLDRRSQPLRILINKRINSKKGIEAKSSSGFKIEIM